MDNTTEFKNKGCPECGSTTIHSCTGSSLEWTEEEKQQFLDALSEYEEE